jgi:hypothetical protein
LDPEIVHEINDEFGYMSQQFYHRSKSK